MNKIVFIVMFLGLSSVSAQGLMRLKLDPHGVCSQGKTSGTIEEDDREGFSHISTFKCKDNKPHGIHTYKILNKYMNTIDQSLLVTFKNGLFHGPTYENWEGFVNKSFWWEGRRHGLWTDYYSNGLKQEEIKWVHGVIIYIKLWKENGTQFGTFNP